MAIVGILFVALGLYAWKLAASAIQVKDSVTSAVGQAETIMSAVAAGDLPGADAQMKSVEKNLAAAESGIEGWEWGRRRMGAARWGQHPRDTHRR